MIDRAAEAERDRLGEDYCAVDFGGGPCWCGQLGCARAGTRPQDRAEEQS